MVTISDKAHEVLANIIEERKITSPIRIFLNSGG
jgi:Fe-S cluster assembly iron-binding protein IscA